MTSSSAAKYLDGVSVEKLAKMNACSISKMRRRLLDQGVVMRERSPGPRAQMLARAPVPDHLRAEERDNRNRRDETVRRLRDEADEAYRELAKVRTQKDLEIRSLSERIAAEKEYAEGLRVKLSSANHQVEDALEQVRALKFEISIYKKLGKVTVL
jgi:hypothetical protein